MGSLTVEFGPDRSDAEPGSLVIVRVRTVAEEKSSPTATGFVASLRYDPRLLEPVAGASPATDGVLRVVNLEAAEGLIRAAGAGADGLGSPVLFATKMRVKGAGYADGLELELQELDIIENDFADVAAQTAVRRKSVR